MVKVLLKADRILRVIAAQPGIEFSALQIEVGMHKATLSNILKTLTHLGYAVRDSDGGCRIGSGLLHLVAAESERLTLSALAQDCVRLLAAELRETVTVGKLLDGDRFNLAKASVDRTVSVNARIELRPSPYDTATGRVLLGFCGEDELQRVIEKHGLPGAGWQGIATQADLVRELASIRAAGEAELAQGDAHSVAVPVLMSDGRAVAAVGAAVPNYRLNAEGRKRIRRALRSAADQMAHALEMNQPGDW